MKTSGPVRRITAARVLIALPFGILLFLFAWVFLVPFCWYLGYEPREGDVLFQSLPRGSLVNAIEESTGSPWSHCGIVAKEDGQWIVYESIGEVRRTPLFEFWRRSRQSRFAVYRFREEHQAAVPRVIECLQPYMGRPYDVRYEMDDAKIYCSELIYKAFRDATGQAMGRLVKLGDLDWGPHESLIRRIEGGPVPVDREMITPRDLAEAEQLELMREW